LVTRVVAGLGHEFAQPLVEDAHAGPGIAGRGDEYLPEFWGQAVAQGAATGGVDVEAVTLRA